MSIRNSFFANPKSGSTKSRLAVLAEATRIEQKVAEFIHFIGPLAFDPLKQRVPYWTLRNEFLLGYLGYLAGAIDAAHRSVGAVTDKDDWTATEIIFHQVIDFQLDWISGCDGFLESHRIGIESGVFKIPSLQWHPDRNRFIDAMKLGTTDYRAFSEQNILPSGLIALGLFPTEVQRQERSDFSGALKKEVIAASSDRTRQYQLLDLQFFLVDCLSAAYGHCIIHQRNVISSDLAIIRPIFARLTEDPDEVISRLWFYEIKFQPQDKQVSPTPYAINIDCSEQIILRDLVNGAKPDTDNCFDVAKDILLYLAFSRGVETIQKFLRFYRKLKIHKGEPLQAHWDFFNALKFPMDEVVTFDMDEVRSQESELLKSLG